MVLEWENPRSILPRCCYQTTGLRLTPLHLRYRVTPQVATALPEIPRVLTSELRGRLGGSFSTATICEETQP